MCGIAGVLHLDGAPVPRELLEAQAASLRHRGPDAEGYLIDTGAAPSLGLAHRRLSIIDLSHDADQPLGTEDGRIQVALNGEIYNFAELRRGLEGRHRFRSNGDTEVLAHLFEEEGEAALSKLDGMFAVAIWDGRRRRLLLARDPFGKKPLYYWHGEGRFVFGSEIKALLAAGLRPGLDESHLGAYLAHGYVPTPFTLLQGVHRLVPGSWVAVDASGLRGPCSFWDLRFPPDNEAKPVSIDEAATHVLELLEAAVRKRLVADVPLGVLLSGGVDSSAVAALAARLQPGAVRTFTLGFEGDAFFDERPHAALVAGRLGAEHHASLVRADAGALIETLLDHHDEPFGDSSALPTYLVAREARRHVTVALNGDGGDEVFAGYDRFGAALLAARLPPIARQTLRVLAAGLPQGLPARHTLARLGRFGRYAALPLEEQLASWAGVFDTDARRRLDGRGLREPARVLEPISDALRHQASASLLSRILYANARTYLLDDLLPKMDRMTMAHGLEARSPFLDRALVEYVAGLPDHLKRRGARGKVVLKHALARLLPPQTLARPKQGFGVPVGDWFRGPLRPMAEDLLLGRPRLAALLRGEALKGLMQEHLSCRFDRGHQLWALLTLELWLRKHRLS
jgi:asparagine synthase (glutamine-hydrolysing)